MPRISIKIFKGEFVQDLANMGPLEQAGPSAAEQVNAWLAENDVMPVDMSTEMTKLPTENPSLRRLMHTITVAAMSRTDWEEQQARIMAAAMKFRDAERI